MFIPTHDRKLLVLEEAAPKVATAFDNGVILPFAALFPQTEVQNVSEDDKRGRAVIQLSFLARDGAGRVLLTRRAAHGCMTPFGHGTTMGGSVLVSWSPVSLPPGHPWPLTHEDILWAYRQEVEEVEPVVPEFRFLGLARSFAGLEVTYYLYAFVVTYSGTPTIRRLKKDKDDEIAGFVGVDHALLQAIAKKKGDLRVLQAAGFDIGAADYGRSSFLAPASGDPPPYRPTSPGCFVSHACADHSWVDTIGKRIVGAGVPCWIDKRDTRPGFLWRPEYLDALDCARSFVLVATRNSFASPPVREEIRRAMVRPARDSAFPVVALVLEGEKINEFLPTEWNNERQATDLRTPDEADAAWPAVLDELKKAWDMLTPPSSRGL